MTAMATHAASKPRGELGGCFARPLKGICLHGTGGKALHNSNKIQGKRDVVDPPYGHVWNYGLDTCTPPSIPCELTEFSRGEIPKSWLPQYFIAVKSDYPGLSQT